MRGTFVVGLAMASVLGSAVAFAQPASLPEEVPVGPPPPTAPADPPAPEGAEDPPDGAEEAPAEEAPTDAVAPPPAASPPPPPPPAPVAAPAPPVQAPPASAPHDFGGTPPPPPPPGYYGYARDDVDAEPEIRNGFSAKIGLGPMYRSIHGHDVWGGQFAVALGAQFKDFGAIHGEFGYSVGKTDGGLKTETFSFGPTWEFIIDRFRIGLGPQFTFLWMERVTVNDSMFGGGMGFSAFLGFDLVEGKHANLHLGLDGRYSWLDEGLGYGGLGLMLGGRFKTP